MTKVVRADGNEWAVSLQDCAKPLVDCLDVDARASDLRRPVCESVPSDTLVPDEGAGVTAVERKANGASHVRPPVPRVGSRATRGRPGTQGYTGR